MNKRRILISIALCLLVAAPALADSSKNVVVVNLPSQPVPTQATGVTAVQNVDEPALQPFQARATANIAPGDSGTNAFVTIPSGKRLVIQYASAYGDAPSGQVLTFSVQTEIPGETNYTEHDVPAAQQNANGGTEIFVAGSPVELYADSPQVLLRVDRNGATTGTVYASISISGYLVDLPQ